jgi:hypothetical protein
VSSLVEVIHKSYFICRERRGGSATEKTSKAAPEKDTLQDKEREKVCQEKYVYQ